MLWFAQLNFIGDAFVFRQSGTDTDSGGSGSGNGANLWPITIPDVFVDINAAKAEQDQHIKEVTADFTAALSSLADGVAYSMAALSSEKDANLEDAKDALATVNATVASVDLKLDQETNFLTQSIAKTNLVALENAAADADTLKQVGALYTLLTGTSVEMHAKDCASIKAARPLAQSGEYWIKSAVQAGAVLVYCEVVGTAMKNHGGDGTSQARAQAHCDSNTHWRNQARQRWIDPDAEATDTTNALLITCPSDLLIKLAVADAHVADWSNVAFWESTTPRDDAQSENWRTYNADIKSTSYTAVPVGKQIEIVAIFRNRPIGRAVYDILPQYEAKTLHDLLHVMGGQDRVIGRYNAVMSNNDRPVWTRHMIHAGGNNGQQPFDLFVDTTGDLVAVYMRKPLVIGCLEHTK